MVWESIRVPLGHSCLGDHMSISHTRYRIQVAVVSGNCLTTAATVHQRDTTLSMLV